MGRCAGSIRPWLLPPKGWALPTPELGAGAHLCLDGASGPQWRVQPAADRRPCDQRSVAAAAQFLRRADWHGARAAALHGAADLWGGAQGRSGRGCCRRRVGRFQRPSSVLVRTYAWMVLLGRNGVFNRLLIDAHVINDPLPLLHNFSGVLIGMVHVLLPYMVLPIYGAVRRVDPAVVAAAEGLGASNARARCWCAPMPGWCFWAAMACSTGC